MLKKIEITHKYIMGSESPGNPCPTTTYAVSKV